jgi:hypothetical protein
VVKLRQLLPGLFVLCLLLGFTAQSLNARALDSSTQNPKPPEVGSRSNPPAQFDQVKTDWQKEQKIPDAYDPMAENELFKLYANKANLGFIVIDKRSGYVWYATQDEFAGDDRLNKIWRAFASSGISIEYLDQKAVSRRISIINSNVSVDITPIDQGFQASVKFIDFSITVGVTVKLESSGVSVEVPFTSIKEDDANFKLGLLHVYPFMGATRADSVPGYMFIPDGSGSLIRLNSVTKAKNMFFERYYGPDLGMITSLPYDRTINRRTRLSQ